MNTALTDTQIRQYRNAGWLHCPGFLDDDEVSELKGAVLDAVEQMGGSKLTGGKREMKEGANYYDKVFTQRINLWRINDTVKSYMLNPDVGRMASELEGVDGFRVWHDQTLIKEPFGNQTSLHLDNPYWSFSSRHATSIWIALEDATLENGCLWFLPGSHRLGRFEAVGIGADMNGIFDVYPEMAEIDPVPAPMKAGDCSFHNGLLAHGAGANMTRKRRIAMTCGYMPDGSTFNGQTNILPADYLETLTEGDVLDDEHQNPLVYRRVAEVTT